LWLKSARYAKMMTRSNGGVVTAIGEDAIKSPAYKPDGTPMLTIIVAGETARSQNFSLNGYGVETNPKMAKLPVGSFSDLVPARRLLPFRCLASSLDSPLTNSLMRRVSPIRTCYMYCATLVCMSNGGTTIPSTRT
jgi:hypothetical protein